MEIQVGEYARTNKGKIFKFAWVTDENGEKKDYILVLTKNEHGYLNYDKYWFNKDEYILKHSKDITEILEDKDIIKIEISEEWVEKEDAEKLLVFGKDITKEELIKDLENGIYKIKSIVTHQSFKQVEYEV